MVPLSPCCASEKSETQEGRSTRLQSHSNLVAYTEQTQSRLSVSQAWGFFAPVNTPLSRADAIGVRWFRRLGNLTVQLEEGVGIKGKRFSEHSFQCPTEKVAEKKCYLVIFSALKNLAEKIVLLK